MTLTFEPESPPLRIDESGAVRVGKTRVLLVLVVQTYLRGESPEGIIDMFDTLDLADVHGAIAYYLRRKAEVEEYVAEFDRQARELRKQIEASQGELGRYARTPVEATGSQASRGITACRGVNPYGSVADRKLCPERSWTISRQYAGRSTIYC